MSVISVVTFGGVKLMGPAELRAQADHKRQLSIIAHRVAPSLSLPEQAKMRQQAHELETEAASLDAQADALDSGGKVYGF